MKIKKVIIALLIPMLTEAVVGTFTSVAFDTGGMSNFGTITWYPETQATGCELKFQIATNNDNNNWVFLGPGGLISTYYTKTSTIWDGHNKNRYIKYRVLFISDGKDTPILDKVKIGYEAAFSPTKDVVFYNWPNPVFGYKTNFYYRIPEAKEIKIKIYDLSYDLKEELSGYGREGNIIWDTSNIASGVYLAAFKAGGYKKVCKVMVIK